MILFLFFKSKLANGISDVEIEFIVSNIAVNVKLLILCFKPIDMCVKSLLCWERAAWLWKVIFQAQKAAEETWPSSRKVCFLAL